MTKKYIKRFGKNRNNIIINATTWDGKYPVKIITPKHPTKKIRDSTVDFLMELDDHDGYDE